MVAENTDASKSRAAHKQKTTAPRPTLRLEINLESHVCPIDVAPSSDSDDAVVLRNRGDWQVDVDEPVVLRNADFRRRSCGLTESPPQNASGKGL